MKKKKNFNFQDNLLALTGVNFLGKVQKSSSEGHIEDTDKDNEQMILFETLPGASKQFQGAIQ